MKRGMGVAALATMCVFSANAAEMETERFYAGAAIGQNKIEIDDVDFSGNDTALKLFAGIHLNQYFDVEGGYIYGGKAEDRIFGTNVGVKTTGFQAALVGNVALNERLTLFAKLGGIAAKAKLTAPGLSASDDGNDVMYGIGGKLAFNRAQLRLEFETAEIEDTEFQLITLGFSIPF